MKPEVGSLSASIFLDTGICYKSARSLRSMELDSSLPFMQFSRGQKALQTSQVLDMTSIQDLHGLCLLSLFRAPQRLVRRLRARIWTLGERLNKFLYTNFIVSWKSNHSSYNAPTLCNKLQSLIILVAALLIDKCHHCGVTSYCSNLKSKNNAETRKCSTLPVCIKSVNLQTGLRQGVPQDLWISRTSLFWRKLSFTSRPSTQLSITS